MPRESRKIIRVPSKYLLPKLVRYLLKQLGALDLGVIPKNDLDYDGRRTICKMYLEWSHARNQEALGGKPAAGTRPVKALETAEPYHWVARPPLF